MSVFQLGNRIQVPSELVGDTAGAIDLGTNDKAIFMPFRTEKIVKITSIELAVDTQSGNADVGIYSLAGKRLTSAGSTPVGVAGIQSFDVTDIILAPGAYYAAFVASTTAAKIWGSALKGTTAVNMAAFGFGEMLAALPLPATATIAVMTSGSYPILYLIPSGAW